jgi:ribokinase
MSSTRIVVIGSCNTDMVIKAGRLPLPGETILGGAFLMNPGGKGANQAVAAARLGGSVTLIANTGDDVFGQKTVEGLRNENINTDYIFSDAAHPSGVALITVDSSGENCIVVASGANAFLDKSHIDQAAAVINHSGIMLMQLEIPIETVEYAAAAARSLGIRVILNPAPAQKLPDSLFRNLYMIIPNRNEAQLLSGITVDSLDSARKAAGIISSKGVDIVVLTLGVEGVLLKEHDDYHYVAADKADAVDTTAAGDTFCGAVCVGLSEGKSILDSVKLGVKAAAITVSRMGAQQSIPHRSEIYLEFT